MHDAAAAAVRIPNSVSAGVVFVNDRRLASPCGLLTTAFGSVIHARRSVMLVSIYSLCPLPVAVMSEFLVLARQSV